MARSPPAAARNRCWNEKLQTRGTIAAARRDEVGAAELDDPSLYFNRELSWIEFNQRVLELAEDPSVPLLERVKFCAIYASNLDEYFMVRVAGLWDQVDAGIDARGPDGLAPREQIDAIRNGVAGARQAPACLLRRHAAAGAGGAGDPHRLAGVGQPRRSARRSPTASTTRSFRH